MNILIEVLKIPFTVVNLLVIEVIDFFLLLILDLFNFFKSTKE
jgi:hypothetical protein